MRSRATRLFLALALSSTFAAAHALLEESTPAAGSTIDGSALEIKLRFNTRIDGKRSQLDLITADGKSQPLTLEPQSEQQVVSTHTTLAGGGEYRLRWQVLAVDGHITRGEIPFHVTAHAKTAHAKTPDAKTVDAK